MMKLTNLYSRAVFLLLFLFTALSSCQKSLISEKLEKQQLNQNSTLALAGTENAAPSQHLYFSFPSDAIAKIHKIKITQSADAEYFSVHNYAGGYNGLQQTPDNSFGTPNILIASLWDPNTAGGVLSRVAYTAPNTISSRFGGEGDGYKTINPYQWALNTWYNIAIRSWKLNGELFIGTFIQNMSTGIWLHTSTLAIPERTTFLGSGNDSFLENWTGSNPAYDGRFVRKAFFKDCWNLSTNNVWQKHTSRSFSANDGDAGRNGIYDRAFNAGYDTTEDAYFMEHGGTVQPNAAFGIGRTLNLPAQTNQGTAPVITVGETQSISAIYSGNTIYISWNNNTSKTPQFSSKVELIDPNGTVINTIDEVLPQKRSVTINNATLGTGTYTARVTITDIFNQVAPTISSTLIPGNLPVTLYRLKNASSGLYLSVEGNSMANSAYIVQSISSAGAEQKWKLSTQNGATVLINNNSNKAIDISGGTQTSGANVIQYTVSNALNQQWNLVSAGTNKYVIQSNMSNHYVLDNPGSSSTNGQKISLYSMNGTTGTANQQWILEPQ